MIPFSVEWETKHWELRDNPVAKQVGVVLCSCVWQQVKQRHRCRAEFQLLYLSHCNGLLFMLRSHKLLHTYMSHFDRPS